MWSAIMASSLPTVHGNDPTYRRVSGDSANISPITLTSPQIELSDDPKHPTVTGVWIQQDGESGAHSSGKPEMGSRERHESIAPTVKLLNNDHGRESQDVTRPSRYQNSWYEKTYKRLLNQISETDWGHWITPRYMISLFCVGLFFGVGHHFYHHSLVGVAVGDNWQQLWTRG
jgi:hypothetical protein